MTLRSLALFACLTALPLRAEPSELVAGAEHSDINEAEFRFTGHAFLRDGTISLTADEIRYDAATRNVVTAIGNVVATRGNTRLLADRLLYRRKDGTFEAEQVRLGINPYYVAGASASGNATEITITHAAVSYGEPGPWQPSVTAEKIVYSPGHRLRTEKSAIGIGNWRFLSFSRLTQEFKDPLPAAVALSGGYRRSLGAYGEAGLHLPVAPGVQAGADLAIYTSRGVMFGPAASYSTPSKLGEMSGYFRSGFISDHGDLKTDLIGRPVPKNRGFLEWQHSQQITEQLALEAQLGWWKDSEILRDYRPDEFFRVQKPDTFIEATYTGRNYFLSAFGRFQPNNFDVVPERLPEVRFDLMPLAIGGGLIERFNASATVLRQTSPLRAPTLQADRLDAYYGVSRPIAPNDWFSLTPVVGARVTHYANTEGVASPRDYTRTLGEIGFDTALLSSGTFDYKNEQWGIDGLRHLFTPRVNYRYIPEADKGRAHIPAIDANVFSTYLPALGLGEARNIDTLSATNTLRLGFDNTVQTRDATYGSRDLLTFNLAVDFRFKRTRAQREVSVVESELAFAPARWVQIDAFSQINPQPAHIQEFNSGLTIHDGTAWSMRFSNNYLGRQIQDYFLDARTRLNERFDALVRLRYDARKRRLNEQAYGIVQNLDHAWRVSYIVSLTSGSTRESHFGFSVELEAIRF